MIQKIKDYFKKRAELKRGIEYYKLLQCGALFLKFIYNDLENMNNTLNRETRRRFQQQLARNGKLNMEIVQHYATKIDQILNYIQVMQKNSKPRVVKPAVKKDIVEGPVKKGGVNSEPTSERPTEAPKGQGSTNG